LARLRSEVNAKWPNRSTASDGWIGDPAHSSRESDHNPNSRGMVNALDITAKGINPYTVVNAAIKHPSTNYIIFDGRIYSRSSGFKSVRYGGPNPHETHVHISIQQSRTAEQNTRAWLTTATAQGDDEMNDADRKWIKAQLDAHEARMVKSFAASNDRDWRLIRRIDAILKHLGIKV